MIFLGTFKAGAAVKYRANFHNDQGTIENPTAPEAQLETPAGVFSALTTPAIVNAKTGHYGGSVDTTGFAVGVYFIRMAGTVTTAKTTASEFCFQIVAYDPDDAAGLGLSRMDATVGSRLPTSSYTAPDNTSIGTILTACGNLDAAVSSRLASASYTPPDLSNLDVAVSSRLAGASYVAPANSDIASVKSKTDQLTFTVPTKVDATASLTPAQIEVIADAVVAVVGTAVWEAPVRALTQSAAQVAAIVLGSDVTVLRGDSWDVFLQNIGSLLGRTKLWFTAKRSKDDADAAAVVQITEDGGLVVLNGVEVSGGGTAQGVLHVEDEGLGRLTIELAGTASKDIAEQSLFYDIQLKDSAGHIITRTEGVLQVVADVTREVS